MKFLAKVILLFSVLSSGSAQVHEQHPYRQIILKTKVKVESSRQKEARYRYSPWGNLSSSDRRYTQKVRLRITISNVSAIGMKDIRVQYRIYKRNLDRNDCSVAAAGEITIPQLRSNETTTLLTDEALCQYRLRWNRLVRGSRISGSGEKYIGYVVIYCDRKGPVRWDMSSQTMYAEYARELRNARKPSAGSASSKQSPLSVSPSEKVSPLPYSPEATVYVTRTGRKFHRKGCRFLRTGARPITKKDALKSGYTPCAICKP